MKNKNNIENIKKAISIQELLEYIELKGITKKDIVELLRGIQNEI